MELPSCCTVSVNPLQMAVRVLARVQSAQRAYCMSFCFPALFTATLYSTIYFTTTLILVFVLVLCVVCIVLLGHKRFFYENIERDREGEDEGECSFST